LRRSEAQYSSISSTAYSLLAIAGAGGHAYCVLSRPIGWNARPPCGPFSLSPLVPIWMRSKSAGLPLSKAAMNKANDGRRTEARRRIVLQRLGVGATLVGVPDPGRRCRLERG